MPLPYREQTLWGRSHQIPAIGKPPEEAAAAPMALAQALEQQLRIQGSLKLQLLTHGQHQFAQLVFADQMQGLIHGLAVGPMPGTTTEQTGNRLGWCWRLGLHQQPGLLPKLLCHQARGDLPTKAA